MVEVAKRHYPFLPVSLMLRHRFDSLARVPQIEAPLLCLVRRGPGHHGSALARVVRSLARREDLARSSALGQRDRCHAGISDSSKHQHL